MLEPFQIFTDLYVQPLFWSLNTNKFILFEIRSPNYFRLFEFYFSNNFNLFGITGSNDISHIGERHRLLMALSSFENEHHCDL